MLESLTYPTPSRHQRKLANRQTDRRNSTNPSIQWQNPQTPLPWSSEIIHSILEEVSQLRTRAAAATTEVSLILEFESNQQPQRRGSPINLHCSNNKNEGKLGTCRTHHIISDQIKSKQIQCSPEPNAPFCLSAPPLPLWSTSTRATTVSSGPMELYSDE